MDAYGESEQVTAFLTVLEEHLALPFGATVLDEAVVVEKIDLSGADEPFAMIGEVRIPDSSCLWYSLYSPTNQRRLSWPAAP